MTQWHCPAVDACSCAGVANLGVYAICEVEYCGTTWEFVYISLGSEDEHLIFIQFHLELVDTFCSLTCLKHSADIAKPLVKSRVTLNAFIAPMCSDTTFCHFVHAFCAYLHLHPFLLRTYNGDMKTLVAVCLRHANPVPQSLRVGLIHRRHYGKSLPALHLLLLKRAVKDYADSEEVIHSLKGTALLPHLLPNRVYGFRTALDMEFQTGLLQALADRSDKTFYICITACLCLVQLILDVVVGIMLRIFQRKIFQFRLQPVKTQFMCQWGIQEHTLLADLASQFILFGIPYLTHEVETVGNHNEYHSHILCQREEKVTEILCLYYRILSV